MSRTETGAYTDVDKKEDVKILHSMGYAQELDRRMSRFSNFAISFSIICIMSGGINSLAQAMSGAGGRSSDLDGRSAAPSPAFSHWRWPRSARLIRRPAGFTTGARSSAIVSLDG